MIKKLPSIEEFSAGLKELSMLSAKPLHYDESQPKNKRKGIFVTVKMEYGDDTDCIAQIFFTKKGTFDYAFVFEPGRWKHCTDEGLTMDQAMDESIRVVYTATDVENFLKRLPYDWEGKERWMKKLKITKP